MTDELDQRRNNVRILELFAESYDAHKDGDLERSTQLMDQADKIDATVVLALTGAMRIGNVPRPGTEQWWWYLGGQRDALAALEARHDALAKLEALGKLEAGGVQPIYKVVTNPEDVSRSCTASGRDTSTTLGVVVADDFSNTDDLGHNLEEWAGSRQALRDEHGDPVTVAFPVREDPGEWDRLADEELLAVGLRRTGPWEPLDGLLIAAPVVHVEAGGVQP